MVKKREVVTHQNKTARVTHKTSVQGTQGGIVCTCSCGDLYTCDFPSEVDEWKQKHQS